jgi:hypothetical protein
MTTPSFDKVRSEPLPLPPEDPKLARLYQLWNEQRGAQPMPDRSVVKPECFHFMLGLINLTDVSEGPPFRFRLVGTDITQRHDRELTSKTTAVVRPRAYRETVEHQYAECRDRRTPTFYRVIVSDGHQTRSYHRLLLPYADHAGTVVLLVGGSFHVDRIEDVVRSRGFLED